MRRRPPVLIGAVTDYSAIPGDGGNRSGISWLGCTLILGSFLFFALILIGITLSLTITSPEARVVIPTFPTMQATTTANTTGTTGATTTTTLLSTTIAPTTAPVYPNVTIVCPANFTQRLGQSLEPTVYPTVGGNCSSAPLIITWIDSIASTSAAKRHMPLSAPPPPPPLRGGGGGGGNPRTIHKRSGEHVWFSELLGTDKEPVLLNQDEERRFSPASGGGKAQLRSPSFNSPNMIIQGSALTYPMPNVTSSLPAASMANNNQFTVTYNYRGLVLVTNKTTNLLIASFFSQSLAPFGTACSDTFTNNTFTRGGSVVWDADAQRWLLFQQTTNVNDPNATGICIHISSSSNNTNPATSLYSTYFYPMPIETRLMAGLWRKAYVLTFLAAGGSEESKLCALERSTFLNPLLLPVNQTAVMFCVHAFENNAPHTWVPVVTALDIRPTEDIETINSPSAGQLAGATFMRVVDDEFYRNGSSPTVDQLEVEHWFNINFTTATFNSIRYPILIADFDDRWNATVATPVSGVNLRVTKGLQRPVAFGRNNTLVLSYTSSNATVFWSELSWQRPNFGTPPRWVLAQQGNVSDAFSPGIQLDSNGTMVLAFERSSNATYPSLFITSRLANDPLGLMRQESLLSAGFSGSLFTNGNEWSAANAISASHDDPRNFFVAGLVSSMPPQAAFLRMYKVRVLAEVVQRVWTVTDSGNCPGGGAVSSRNASCTQYINTL